MVFDRSFIFLGPVSNIIYWLFCFYSLGFSFIPLKCSILALFSPKSQIFHTVDCLLPKKNEPIFSCRSRTKTRKYNKNGKIRMKIFKKLKILNKRKLFLVLEYSLAFGVESYAWFFSRLEWEWFEIWRVQMMRTKEFDECS